MTESVHLLAEVLVSRDHISLSTTSCSSPARQCFVSVIDLLAGCQYREAYLHCLKTRKLMDNVFIKFRKSIMREMCLDPLDFYQDVVKYLFNAFYMYLFNGFYKIVVIYLRS